VRQVKLFDLQSVKIRTG